MKVDYRLRLAGTLDESQDAVLRETVGSLVAMATDAGLEVQADPIFFTVTVAPEVDTPPPVVEVPAEVPAEPPPDEGAV